MSSANEQLYRKVEAALKQHIASMKVGDRIPSRNVLIKRYSVTRTTIDRAVGELEKEGFLSSVKGSGTFVTGKAKSLQNRPSLSIGLVIPNIQFYNYPGIVRGVTDVAEERSINVVICNTDNQVEKQQRHVQQLIQSGIDGVIIAPITSGVETQSCEWLEQKRIPFVLVNHGITGLCAPLSTQNNFYGAYIATEYLLKSSHRRIAFFSRPMYTTNKERFHGYLSALYSQGIAMEEDLVHFQVPVEKPYATYDESYDKYDFRATEKLLQTATGIDAVVCADDRLAYNAIRHMLAKGIRIPDDISVFGFDNSEICNISPVKISSVSFDRHAIGVNAANLLLEKLDRVGRGLNLTTTMPELVIRESTVSQRRYGPADDRKQLPEQPLAPQ